MMTCNNAMTALLLVCFSSADGFKIYSPPSWSVQNSMPYAASDFTATTLGEKIYIVGGCDGPQNFDFDFDGYYCSSVTDKVLVYDPATDTFEELAAAPRARYRHAAVAVGTEILVFGGKTLDDRSHLEVDVLDTATGTWKTRGVMKNPTSDLAAFVLGGTVYAVGGYDSGYTALDTVSAMDPATGGWTTLVDSSLNTARGDLGIGVVDGQVFAFGGWTHEDEYATPHASLETLDAATMTWTKHPEPAKLGRGDKAVVGLHGRVLVLGGETKDAEGINVPLDDVEAFHPTATGVGAGGWTNVGTLLEKRFRFAAAALGDSVYVFGGQGYRVGGNDANGSYYPVVSSVTKLSEQYLDTDTEEHDEHEHGQVIAALACGVLGLLLGASALLVALTNRSGDRSKPSATDPNSYYPESDKMTQA